MAAQTQGWGQPSDATAPNEEEALFSEPGNSEKRFSCLGLVLGGWRDVACWFACTPVRDFEVEKKPTCEESSSIVGSWPQKRRRSPG